MGDTIQVGPYMKAERVPCSPHDVWIIESRDGATLGHVEWNARWKCYELCDVNPDAGFTPDCLAALARFVEGLR